MIPFTGKFAKFTPFDFFEDYFILVMTILKIRVGLVMDMPKFLTKTYMLDRKVMTILIWGIE